VDVLKLTYATLEQINQMNTPEGEGPMWNRFWNTIDNDTESVHSADGISGVHSHRAETPISPHEHTRGLSGELPGLNRFTNDSVVPNDSASFAAVQDDLHSNSGSPAVKDDSFLFKFKSPAGRTHRLRFDTTLGLEDFRAIVGEKLTSEEKAVIGGIDPTNAGFAVSFVDDEGDVVSILSIADLSDSVAIAKRSGRDKVDIYVHHPNQPPRVEATPQVAKVDHPETVDKIVEAAEKRSESPSRKESVGGIPTELLLPGAIVVLAVVIVGVFVATRSSGKLR